jgi:signal peptidase I
MEAGQAVGKFKITKEVLVREAREWGQSILIAFLVAFVIRLYVVQAFKIPSGSMRPTLIEGDKLFVNKFIYRFHHPERGDIVAAYMVVQMEGEAIQVEVMTREDIIAIRDRSRASKAGPWVTDFAEMCRKTVVRRGCKYLPMDTEEAEPLARAMELDADDFEPMVPSLPERKAPPTLREKLNLEPTQEQAPEREVDDFGGEAA